ncbi:MAG: CHRD domain-containing protein [Chitinophagaceae bacterium]|nr:CHRD domain-containing protein [Chitinophagaceae bacterium]
MRMLNLLMGLALVISLGSCNQDLNTTILGKKDVPLEGSQEVPAKAVAANGTMDLAYNRTTRTLTYTVRWNSLTGPITGMHIHGSAGPGFNAGIVQNFTGYSTAQAGSYSGTFLVDGLVVKEDDFLRGGYYLNIHTALNPGGEIRGQIKFD